MPTTQFVEIAVFPVQYRQMLTVVLIWKYYEAYWGKPF